MSKTMNLNKRNYFQKSENVSNPSTDGSSNTFHAGSTKTISKINTEKKPFDKKKFRLQKYSLKYKLQNWEDKRKKHVLRGYYKELSHDNEKKFDVGKIYAEDDEEKQDDSKAVEKVVETKETPFQKAHLELLRIKGEKNRKKEERQKNKMEKEEAFLKSKREKAEKYKKLNQKTKRGQPIMKNRLEDLLERIQKST